MSFLKKLFGSGDPPKEQPAQDPAQDPNMIRVYDAYGRELFISKEEWRKNVLPGSLQASWNKPDELFGIIVGALGDGFRTDVIPAAEQLFKIDPDRVRATCVWGIVLKDEGRLDAAEKVFRDFLIKHGEEGSVLTNLAKVYSRRKKDAQAEEILWHALEVDPNQENGLSWYWIIHKERGGEGAGSEALRRVAALPKSWRAQLWLAREALARRDLPGAMTLYDESLGAAPAPAPADLLEQMSGDLGNAGHLPEILNLILPRYEVALHGLRIGNNLIKTMVDLGQLAPARKLLQQLYAQNRLDWKATLNFWDTELAKAHLATTPIEQGEKLNIGLLKIDGPVWLPEQSPALALFPALSANATRLSFLGSSAETGHTGDAVTAQLTDPPGRLSRALPLFLSEQVRFRSDANPRTIVPWVKAGGFVLASGRWTDEAAAGYARMEPASDYLILVHLRAAADPWTADLRLIRTIDAKCLETIERSFSFAQLAESAQLIARDLLNVLSRHADVALVSSPLHYSLPVPADLPTYLLRLEQLLAARSSGLEGATDNFLSGHHEIIDGNIHLCIKNRKNPITRILLLQTIKALKKVYPEIVAEYREKLELLQREHPLDEPAQEVCKILLHQVLAA
jgi:tetratricopeptide (TPR) repeat protein